MRHKLITTAALALGVAASATPASARTERVNNTRADIERCRTEAENAPTYDQGYGYQQSPVVEIVDAFSALVNGREPSRVLTGAAQRRSRDYEREVRAMDRERVQVYRECLRDARELERSR